MENWTARQVAEWVTRSGFAEYAQTFEKNDITGDVLPTITNDVLREDLKVSAYGHRIKLVNAIQKLIEACATIPAAKDTAPEIARASPPAAASPPVAAVEPAPSPGSSPHAASYLTPAILAPFPVVETPAEVAVIEDPRPLPEIPRRNMRSFYNSDVGRALRLDPTRAHALVQDTSGKRSHCVLCFSISSTSQRRREMNTKWQCAVCQAHLCRTKFGKETTSCYEKFHALPFLEQVQRPRPRPRQYFILPDWDPAVDSLEKLRQRADHAHDDENENDEA
ncbi:hypothetical protein SDRG_01147 [Saprolegnia diclina VS20]|uniref:SAM domain-containing protein n=1 Tax=Saprolegnia diclina (strain VS20) TaxID=1156394 RepID=T0R4A0_SAPDV|nr:hypothetical protein SDRG_01147 [Saprolegnia diclina VS20]EQC41170.1 hypothetical protein SDRG_01147 [Saprolegnia diclina VS20]|eukprot:XP_008604884.1 hypothetical protein SDRG_01147 [Saprolegnia diclina VS20]